MKRYLTEDEQSRLLRAAKGSSDPLAQRDYWWMRLMIATGARVNEFALFTAAQAEAALATGWLIVPPAQRKGGKTGQEYLVTQTVQDCLQALLAMQRAEARLQGEGGDADFGGAAAPLIWGRDGKRLSVRSYQARLTTWAKAAGLGLAVSPHWMRHTRGMNIIRRSRSANPLKVAQQALGHASIASTGIYTSMAREEYEADLRAVDGQRMRKRDALRHAAAAGGGR